MKIKNRHSQMNTRRAAAQILTDLGTPLSSRLKGLLSNDGRLDADFYSVCKSFDPHTAALYGDNWRTFALDYQASSLLKKWDGLAVGVDRAAVACQKFRDSETKCMETNKRIASSHLGCNMPPRIWQVIQLARSKIERVLGKFSWDDAHRFMGFGPGASIGVPRKKGHSWYKISSELTVTGECLALAQAAVAACPQWSKIGSETSDIPGPRFSVVSGSKITTVPKDAGTDRVIAIEPLMNMFIQKGIGGLIRRALKRVGVDLNDQTRNQRLALQGSLTGLLATLDLKSASDTIARALVELLLPCDWTLAMKLCRSNSTILNGETIRLSKFSSMGNGYTFELESLIFWGLCSAVVSLSGEKGRDIGVYGDDLIVPTPCAGLLIEVLDWCGFETNQDKSFVDGPFRESCGKHYFAGHDVTPFYIREDVKGTERNLWCLNSIRRLAHRLVGAGYGCWDALLPSYELVQSWLREKDLALSIPENFGDGGVLRDFDEAHPQRHPSWDGYVFPAYVQRNKRKRAHGQGALYLALLELERGRTKSDAPYVRIGHSRQRDLGGVSPLDIHIGRPVMRLKKRCFTPQWVGLGPWLSLL